MSLQIKSLAEGQLTGSLVDLYTVPSAKTAIIKAMRFVNTHTVAVTIDVYYKKSADRLIFPKSLSIAPGNLVTEDTEITLDAGDKIRAGASSTNKIDFLISGVERE